MMIGASDILNIANLANHFVHAQVQHFDFAREDAAWNWLRQSGNAQLRPAA